MMEDSFDNLGDLLEMTAHFSYYAFEGKTGQRYWSHESGDFLNSEIGPIEEVRRKI